MKIAPIICLLVIALYACGEPKVEKRVYSAKDIEGYWATNAVIQNSEWTVAIVENSEKKYRTNFYPSV